jgi:hypothetical protein
MVMRDLDFLEKYANIWDDVWMIEERDDEEASEQRMAS